MSETEHTILDPSKVTDLIQFLTTTCSGPKEAFALMCVGMIALNDISFIDNITDKPSLETLISDISVAMRSAKSTKVSLQ